MARKSKQMKDELAKAQTRLQEVEKLVTEAENEEAKKLEAAEGQIKTIANGYGMFCGVIISQQDLLNITQLMLENKGEAVRIPFRLYFND